MCRVLTTFGADKPAGRALHSFAWSREVLKSYKALGSWATRAWSASGGWKAGEAVGMLNTIADSGYRRAAVIGFASRASSNSRGRVEAIVQQHPDLAPAVRLALAG